MRQTIFIIIFILILGIGGYYLYQNSGLSAGQTVAETSETRATIETRLADLRRLKDLQLDTSILQNRFFLSLQPTQPATTIDAKTGKPNPFLP